MRLNGRREHIETFGLACGPDPRRLDVLRRRDGLRQRSRPVRWLHQSGVLYQAMLDGQPMTAAKQAYADQEDQLRQLGFRSELGGDIALGQMFYHLAYGMMLPSSARDSASGEAAFARLPSRQAAASALALRTERCWFFQRERWRQRVHNDAPRRHHRHRPSHCSPGGVDLGQDAARFRWPRLCRLARVTKASPALRAGKLVTLLAPIISTYQLVTRDFPRKIFLEPCLGERSRNGRLRSRPFRKGGIVHGTSLLQFPIVSNQLSPTRRTRQAAFGLGRETSRYSAPRR